MSPKELNKCLQKFYLSARKRDGSYYNNKSLTAIRAALDRHLKSPPFSKPFSIVGDSQFSSANKSLSNFLKTLSKKGEIARTVHKQPLTKEVVEKLYEEGELVEIDTLNPAKLQQTAWFFITLFLARRGRENQNTMKKNMLVERKTPTGEAYFEISSERGAILATKNHQGGLNDKEDMSNGKIFERPSSKRCPFQLINKYLSHLNPDSSNLFQKPRSLFKSFNPAKDSVWYSSIPVGHNTIENMLRGMTSRAGIKPYLTNHSVRATTVTVLSASNFESRHIKAITGHQSEASIESYSDTPTFQQFKAMSNEIANFLDSKSDRRIEDQGVPKTTALSSFNASLSNPTASNANISAINVLGIHDGQHLVHGLVPGGTFDNCIFNFNINLPGGNDSSQHKF